MKKRLLLLVVLGAAVAGAVTSNAGAAWDDSVCPPMTVAGTFYKVCPQGYVGTPYSLQIKGREGCWPEDGSSPGNMVTLAITAGALPPGLSMSSSGLISGTPTMAGSFDFYITETDHAGVAWCKDDKSSSEHFLLKVIPGLSLDTTSVPAATLNVPYNTTLTATPAGTQTWTIEGTLPPGLTLGTTNGVISGTPTTLGSYKFAVRVTDSETRSARREYTIDVANAMTIGALPVGPSEVSAPFTETLTVTGGTGPAYTWSLASGALPPGLMLGADGKIAGTPTTAGAYGFTVSVADSVGRTTTQSLKITVASRLVISTLALRPAKVGKLYRARLQTTGGVIPKTWRVTLGPLPRGIRLDRQTGILSGLPRKAGRYRITVQVTDGLRVVATRSLRLTVLSS